MICDLSSAWYNLPFTLALAAFLGLTVLQFIGLDQDYEAEAELDFELVGTATMFYLVERDVNPHIKTFVDALYYISTCLTVGYADLFPATQQGRLIASVVMTLGPALANNVLDPPGRAIPASAHQQAAMLERLDAILAELRLIFLAGG